MAEDEEEDTAVMTPVHFFGMFFFWLTLTLTLTLTLALTPTR